MGVSFNKATLHHLITQFDCSGAKTLLIQFLVNLLIYVTPTQPFSARSCPFNFSRSRTEEPQATCENGGRILLDVVLDFPFYILLSITSSSNEPVRTIVCEFLPLESVRDCFNFHCEARRCDLIIGGAVFVNGGW